MTAVQKLGVSTWIDYPRQFGHGRKNPATAARIRLTPVRHLTRQTRAPSPLVYMIGYVDPIILSLMA
jgi:hypothetical protein